MPSDLFRTGRIFMLDGALGTELERRGIDTSQAGWTSRANLTHPDLVREIHEEYIRSGADIITANTFRTNPRAHRTTGLNAEELTKRGIELAIEARSRCARSVLIAGSIAPAEDCFSPELVPDDSEALFREHAAMAKWITDAGANIILIETMNSLQEAELALGAARSVSDLPIIVSLVIRDSRHMLDGTLLSGAVNALGDADLLSINCTQLSILSAAPEEFVRLSKAAGVPFGFYPNSSEHRYNGEWELRSHSDEEIASAAQHYIDLGATLVGSCCGTTPATTKAISAILRYKEKAPLK